MTPNRQDAHLLYSTFSIVGFDPHTGELGAAVQSKYFAVGAVVPWVEAGVGALVTQAYANIHHGNSGLELLRQDRPAGEVLARLLAQDPGREQRQLGIVDRHGGSAVATGTGCPPHAGHRQGDGYTCQGNLLTTPGVLEAMEQAFLSGAGSLARRLLGALIAGQRVGGDRRGQQSAALLTYPSAFTSTMKPLNLRVDDHPRPVDELGRLLDLWELYHQEGSRDDFIPLEGVTRARLDHALAALHTNLDGFLRDENLTHRAPREGRIDRRLVSFTERLAATRRPPTPT